MFIPKTFFVLAFACIAATKADKPPPSYPVPEPTYHVPERNCSVDFEKTDTEVCVPTLQTTCEEQEVTIKAPVEEERCLTIPMVTCKAEVKTESVEICVYVYEKKEIEAEAKVADVKYTKRCDTEYVSICKEPKPTYGYEPPKPDCQEVPQETCRNRPLAESKETEVTVTVPEPVKKCETKQVKIPTVNCEETTEERCFNLITLQEKVETIEKCHTRLAEPKCSTVTLSLPAQTCVEQLKSYRTYEHYSKH